MNCARGMRGVPFVVFTHVDKFSGGIVVEPGTGLCDGNLLDARLRIIHDLQKTFRVFHILPFKAASFANASHLRRTTLPRLLCAAPQTRLRRSTITALRRSAIPRVLCSTTNAPSAQHIAVSLWLTGTGPQTSGVKLCFKPSRISKHETCPAPGSDSYTFGSAEIG